MCLKQLSNHCRKFDLMPDYQSAYHESYSCKTALVKIVDDILWSMEEGSVSALMALDLSAAFDTVVHSILLKVLQKNWNGRQMSPIV